MTKNCSQTGTKFPKFGRTIWKFPFPDRRRIIEGDAHRYPLLAFWLEGQLHVLCKYLVWVSELFDFA
jgi:hypothetical protein